MLTVDQAIRLVDEHAAALPPVRVKLADALGLVLSEAVLSDIDSPPHNKAMMDGFAVVASDRSPTREIIEEVIAGGVPHHAVRPGGATRVMTGAPVPDGATAVVPVERTQPVDATTVRIDWIDPPTGKHIMPQGASMRVGQQVASAGTLVNSLTLALLAEVGCAAVRVVRRPTVSILATGNELVGVEHRPGPGQIRNSNGPLLAASVAEAGGTPRELPVGRDDAEELASLIHTGLESDVLMVTGGVSAGVKDLVPDALAAAGVDQVFHKLALKPGKPLWFGIVRQASGGSKLVFGLPGNPVSSLVCFHLFVKPALAVLAGKAASVELPLDGGIAAGDFEHRGGRETFRPARRGGAGGRSGVEFCNWQGSADIAGMATANCLVRLPPEPMSISRGDPLDLLPLGWK